MNWVNFGWFVLGFCFGGAAAFLVFFGMCYADAKDPENHDDGGYF